MPASRVGAPIIRTIRSDDRFHLFEIVRVHRLAVEIPSSKLDAHGCFPSPSICNRILLAPIQNCVHFRRVRFVVDDAAIHFDPCVGFERHLLRTDDHLCWHSVFLQKTCCGRGALQAERFLPIPDTGHVDRRVDAFDGIGRWRARCPTG